jgi:phytoene dehydrogenase-like protein
MANTYDAIVVDGGHNGLVSAACTAHRSPRRLPARTR